MFLFAMLLASGDPGGWQYARWGMTEAEVKAAAPNIIVPFAEKSADRDGSFARLVTTHQGGDMTFNVAFRFSEGGKLNGVLVIPKSYENCARILDQMKAAYGEPIDVAAPKYQLRYGWNVPSVGSLIRFYSALTPETLAAKKGPYCEIEHSPAPTPETIAF